MSQKKIDAEQEQERRFTAKETCRSKKEIAMVQHQIKRKRIKREINATVLPFSKTKVGVAASGERRSVELMAS